MGIKRSEAFVLRTVPVGEADRIVTLLTRSSGKVRAVARNAWRSRRRFGGSLEILTRVQAEWFEREAAQLDRLERCDIRASSFDLLQESLEASYLLHYLAELADAFAREQEPDPRSYRLLIGCLEAVRAGAAPGGVARYFELWSLRLHGVLAGLDRCAACGGSMEAGPVHLPAPGSEPVCHRCRPPDRDTEPLAAADGDWMRRLWRTGPIDLCAGPAPGPTVTRFARREIESYLERPLRSRRFLQETLAERPRRPSARAGTGTI